MLLKSRLGLLRRCSVMRYLLYDTGGARNTIPAVASSVMTSSDVPVEFASTDQRVYQVVSVAKGFCVTYKVH